MIQAQKRTFRSDYMEWVKTQTQVRFNLANSGVKNYPLSELPIDFDSLALSGPGAYGYPPLLAAIAEKNGVAKECVATAQGTSMANHLAMAAILSPGDEVLMEHPVYELLPATAEYVGASVKYFERPAEANFAIQLDLLERVISSRTKLIVITNLHNPSCAFTDEPTLRAVGALAESIGARVLVDEVYLDVLFERAPKTSALLGRHFVVTSSLTKVYGLSGLRCGWILADPDLIHRITRMNDLFGVNAAHLADQLSCVAFANLDRIAAWSKQLLDQNRTMANEFLDSTPELQSPRLDVGTVLFPKLQGPSDEFCSLLRRFDTCVTPGRFFGMQDRIRIGIGGETGTLFEGLLKIRQALQL